jgi:hypothetical protein
MEPAGRREARLACFAYARDMLSTEKVYPSAA